VLLCLLYSVLTNTAQCCPAMYNSHSATSDYCACLFFLTSPAQLQVFVHLIFVYKFILYCCRYNCKHCFLFTNWPLLTYARLQGSHCQLQLEVFRNNLNLTHTQSPCKVALVPDTLVRLPNLRTCRRSCCVLRVL